MTVTPHAGGLLVPPGRPSRYDVGSDEDYADNAGGLAADIACAINQLVVDLRAARGGDGLSEDEAEAIREACLEAVIYNTDLPQSFSHDRLHRVCGADHCLTYHGLTAAIADDLRRRKAGAAS